MAYDVQGRVVSAIDQLGNTTLTSYQEIGGKLLLVPKAHSDTDRVQAILSYNASADVFVKNYVAMANVFSTAGVKFTPSDPGSVFAFTDTSL